VSELAPTPRRVNPPHYFFMALVAIAALAWVPVGDPVMPPPWRWLGVLPLALGALSAIAAAGRFARAGTNIVPLTRSTALVTDGPFARSRNPMYLGMTLVLAGIAWLSNAWLPWLVVPAFVLVLTLRFIRHEERLMEATFGDAYRDYRARVRRWI
jgi:protein-S-isoprenylcysteine O-methyltransferase Ste14